MDNTMNTAQLPLPVTYPHLRAHETVLALVCRLLLVEQKQVLDHVGRIMMEQ